jgi:transposase
MIHIGIDMHKRSSEVAAIDDAGQIIDRCTLDHTQREVMQEFFRQFRGQAVATVEATRSWYWFYEVLESCGLQVKMAHPLKVRIIAEAKIKTDKIDALTLAKLERADFLPESYIPSREIRDQRELLRCRVALVRARTIFKNRVHAVLDKLGILHKYTDLFGREGLVFLKTVELRPVYRHVLDEYLAVIEFLDQRIVAVTKLIRATLKEDPRVKRLLTIPGVGELTAYTVLSEIGEIERFSDARNLCSYAGITPTIRQSAEHRWEGHITKQGNRCLRWIMVEAAQVAPRLDPALRYFYDRLADRRGPKKARVAVARKLLIAVWHVLTNNQDYRYNYLAKYQGA